MKTPLATIAVLLSVGLQLPPGGPRVEPQANAPAVAAPMWVRTKTLTVEGARLALAGAREMARSRGVGGAVAVVDAGGHLLLLERPETTFAAAAEVSLGKARSAALFQKPTRAFEQSVNEARPALLGVPALTPLIGGIPLEVDGMVVGAIGVSGASSAQEDEELALAGAAALRAGQTRP